MQCKRCRCTASAQWLCENIAVCPGDPQDRTTQFTEDPKPLLDQIKTNIIESGKYNCPINLTLHIEIKI